MNRKNGASPAMTDRQVKNVILSRQRDWAGAMPRLANDYFADPKSNLPWLTDEIEREIRDGDGAEFGKPGEPAKIAALHSSSALAVNVFGYWCGRERTDLAKALNLNQRVERPHFEQKFRTGVGPRSPNLDVVLPLADGGLVAIESKFTEWIGTSGRKPLREAYLPEDTKRWKEVGLAGAQQVAETFLEEPGFARLDVPQLLKHMLGLANQPKPWNLKLIWYREPSAAADEMDKEIARFRTLLGKDARRFSAMTYQELWSELRSQLGARHENYRKYLEARYFPAPL